MPFLNFSHRSIVQADLSIDYNFFSVGESECKKKNKFLLLRFYYNKKTIEGRTELDYLTNENYIISLISDNY